MGQNPFPDTEALTNGPYLDQCANSLTGLDVICRDVYRDLRLLKHIEGFDELGPDKSLAIYDEILTTSY